MFIYRFDDFFALINGSAQRLLTPDILASLSGCDGDQRVPVWWGGDVDNINNLALQHFAEIFVGLNVGPPRFLGCLEVVFVHVTNSQ